MVEREIEGLRHHYRAKNTSAVSCTIYFVSLQGGIVLSAFSCLIIDVSLTSNQHVGAEKKVLPSFTYLDMEAFMASAG